MNSRLMVLIALSCPSQIGTAVRIRIGAGIFAAALLAADQNLSGIESRGNQELPTRLLRKDIVNDSSAKKKSIGPACSVRVSSHPSPVSLRGQHGQKQCQVHRYAEKKKQNWPICQQSEKWDKDHEELHTQRLGKCYTTVHRPVI